MARTGCYDYSKFDSAKWWKKIPARMLPSYMDKLCFVHFYVDWNKDKEIERQTGVPLPIIYVKRAICNKKNTSNDKNN